MNNSKSIFQDFIKYVSLNILGQMAYSCCTLADTFFVSASLLIICLFFHSVWGYSGLSLPQVWLPLSVLLFYRYILSKRKTGSIF